MAWFRSNRGIAGWLALFALACQFALSFGHVHVAKFGAGLAAPVAVQTAATTGDSPSAPPNKDPAGPAGDFCAICANISLASTLILPVLAIVILALGLFVNVLLWPPAASVPASFDHLPFGARGPPHA